MGKTKRPVLNWKQIIDQADAAAQALGHDLFAFESARNMPGSPARCKTAMCIDCGGCCWVSWIPSAGFRCGGRILRYKCGTPEAMGLTTSKQELSG